MKRSHYALMAFVGFGFFAMILATLSLFGIVKIELPSYYRWIQITSKIAMILGIFSLIGLYVMTRDDDFDKFDH